MPEQAQHQPEKQNGRFSIASLLFSEKIWWLLILLIVLLAGKWLLDRLTYISLDDARLEADIVMLSVPVDSQIISIAVASGDYVQKGQKLAELDTTRVQLQLEQDRAAVMQQRHKFNALKAEREWGESNLELKSSANKLEIQQSEAHVQAARANLAIEEAKLKRQRTLAKQNLISALEVDIQEGRHDSQQWILQSQMVKLDLIKQRKHQIDIDFKKLELLDSKLETEQAKLNELRAKTRYTQSLLAEHIISSPIEGIIDALFMDVGEFTQRSRPIIALHDPSQIWVSANVQEANLEDLQEGIEATVVIDAYNSQTYRVKLTRIKNIANNQLSIIPNTNPSGNFVRIAQRVNLKFEFLDVPQQFQLKPGLLVTINIPKP